MLIEPTIERDFLSNHEAPSFHFICSFVLIAIAIAHKYRCVSSDYNSSFDKREVGTTFHETQFCLSQIHRTI